MVRFPRSLGPKAAALGLALFSLAMAAQSNRGGISGTISDPQGLVVPGAIVVVVNLGTNERVRTTASSNGTYSVQNLEPVTYRIEVQAGGFKKEVIDNVKVDTATTVTRNVSLQIGAATETISVKADSPLVDTDPAPRARRLRSARFRTSPCSTAASWIWRLLLLG